MLSVEFYNLRILSICQKGIRIKFDRELSRGTKAKYMSESLYIWSKEIYQLPKSQFNFLMT